MYEAVNTKDSLKLASLIADDFNHRVQIYNGDKLLKNFGEKGKSSTGRKNGCKRKMYLSYAAQYLPASLPDDKRANLHGKRKTSRTWKQLC